MNIADADLDGLVTEGDPEKDFNGLYEIGHGSFGAVYYVSCVPFLLKFMIIISSNCGICQIRNLYNPALSRSDIISVQ